MDGIKYVFSGEFEDHIDLAQNGTGDYFRTGTSAGMDFGTGDFTIEFWINQSLYNSGDVVADGRAVWNDNGWSVETKNNGIQFYSSGGIVLTTSGTDFSTQTNQWVHVAVVRNSGTVTTYINGTNEGSVSYSTSIDTTGANLYIGRRSDGNTSFDFNGYISDFRIVSSAVYTTDFTPPTERLTAITNTELLTCHAPYISDGSSNSLVTTMSGNTKTALLIEFITISIYLVATYYIAIVLQSSLPIVWCAEFIYFTLLGTMSFIYLKWGNWRKVSI
mgnify:CR=1 FL=1